MRIIAHIAAALICISTAAQAESREGTVKYCLTGAAARNSVPVSALVLLYQNEGGTLGKVSKNTNATVDIGPFQINDTWLPRVSQHWGLTPPLTYQLLLHDLCANSDAAAWILQLCLADARGDLWDALGRYHSNTPAYKRAYLRKIYGHLIANLKKGTASVGDQ